jgi:hypothetical protein
LDASKLEHRCLRCSWVERWAILSKAEFKEKDVQSKSYSDVAILCALIFFCIRRRFKALILDFGESKTGYMAMTARSRVLNICKFIL